MWVLHQFDILVAAGCVFAVLHRSFCIRPERAEIVAGRRAPHTSAALLSSRGTKWHRICSQHGHLAHLCPDVLFKIIQNLDMILNSRLKWHIVAHYHTTKPNKTFQLVFTVSPLCTTVPQCSWINPSLPGSSDRADAGHGFHAVLSGRREGKPGYPGDVLARNCEIWCPGDRGHIGAYCIYCQIALQKLAETRLSEKCQR